MYFHVKLIYLYHSWTDSICCTKNRIKEKHPAKDMSAGCTDFQINTNSAFKIPNRGAFPCLWSLEEFIMPEYLMSCSILQVVVEKLGETKKNLLCLDLL